MARFRYKTVTATGETGEGEMDAATRDEVIARLQALGNIPIRADEIITGTLSSVLAADLRRARHSTRSVSGVIGQLGTLLRAGLPLDQTLEILQDVAGNKDEAQLAARLLDGVRRGQSLADAMAVEPAFSRFCVSMVRAGETSGTLDASLTRLAAFMTQADTAKGKLQSALLYPALVMIACVLSLTVLFAFVVPRFKPFFASAKGHLPVTTRALLGISDLVAQYWSLGLVVICLAVLAIMLALRDKARRRAWDRWLLRAPLFGGLIRKIEIGQWSEVLGTLLKNGVALQGALAIAGETLRNHALAEAAATVARAVVEGSGLAEPLRRAGVFPPLVLRLVRVGEEAARLDDMLLELGAIYARDSERERERLITLIGPTLTIGMGLIVALVMGSIVTAILSVYRLAI